MSDVTVVRGLGDRQGPDIVDSLLVTDSLKISRGTAEIDASTPVIPVATSLPAVGWIAPGTLVEITDIELNKYRAIVDSCNIVYEATDDGSFTATREIIFHRLLGDQQ